MKEIRRMLSVYEQVDHSRRRAALATVVFVEGSAYRRPGARMLVTDDGRWEGAISGGCLEGDALRKAREVMRAGQPRLVRYDTMDDGANSFGIGLGCNGIIDVLIEPIDPGAPDNPLTALRRFVQQREPHGLATVYRTDIDTGLAVGQRFMLGPNHDMAALPAWLRPDLARVMQTGRTQTLDYSVAGGAVAVCIERIDPGIELIIFGAGYDTLPLARLAAELGWPLTITTDCVAHLTPARFPPSTALRHADASVVTDQLILTDRTAAVLMSHNYTYDQAVLTRLLATNVPYIGMLGPAKRYEKMQTHWAESGPDFSAATLNRVHAPVGLDLGAETPDEIALSVLAEIRAFFSGRSGQFLKDRPGPIHERPDVVIPQLK
jgi:xanthine dehydrogenase accessory factor